MAFGHNELSQAPAVNCFSETTRMFWPLATTKYGGLWPQTSGFPWMVILVIGQTQPNLWNLIRVTISQILVTFKVLWSMATTKCGGLRRRSIFYKTSKMLLPQATTKYRPQYHLQNVLRKYMGFLGFTNIFNVYYGCASISNAQIIWANTVWV